MADRKILDVAITDHAIPAIIYALRLAPQRQSTPVDREEGVSSYCQML